MKFDPFLRKGCLDIYMAVTNERPWMIGQMPARPLVLIYNQCLIRLNISNTYNILA